MVSLTLSPLQRFHMLRDVVRFSDAPVNNASHVQLLGAVATSPGSLRYIVLDRKNQVVIASTQRRGGAAVENLTSSGFSKFTRKVHFCFVVPSDGGRSNVIATVSFRQRGMWAVAIGELPCQKTGTPRTWRDLTPGFEQSVRQGCGLQGPMQPTRKASFGCFAAPPTQGQLFFQLDHCVVSHTQLLLSGNSTNTADPNRFVLVANRRGTVPAWRVIDVSAQQWPRDVVGAWWSDGTSLNCYGAQMYEDTETGFVAGTSLRHTDAIELSCQEALASWLPRATTLDWDNRDGTSAVSSQAPVRYLSFDGLALDTTSSALAPTSVQRNRTKAFRPSEQDPLGVKFVRASPTFVAVALHSNQSRNLDSQGAIWVVERAGRSKGGWLTRLPHAADDVIWAPGPRGASILFAVSMSTGNVSVLSIQLNSAFEFQCAAVCSNVALFDAAAPGGYATRLLQVARPNREAMITLIAAHDGTGSATVATVDVRSEPAVVQTAIPSGLDRSFPSFEQVFSRAASLDEACSSAVQYVHSVPPSRLVHEAMIVACLVATWNASPNAVTTATFADWYMQWLTIHEIAAVAARRLEPLSVRGASVGAAVREAALCRLPMAVADRLGDFSGLLAETHRIAALAPGSRLLIAEATSPSTVGAQFFQAVVAAADNQDLDNFVRTAAATIFSAVSESHGAGSTPTWRIAARPPYDAAAGVALAVLSLAIAAGRDVWVQLQQDVVVAAFVGDQVGAGALIIPAASAEGARQPSTATRIHHCALAADLFVASGAYAAGMWLALSTHRFHVVEAIWKLLTQDVAATSLHECCENDTLWAALLPRVLPVLAAQSWVHGDDLELLLAIKRRVDETLDMEAHRDAVLLVLLLGMHLNDAEGHRSCAALLRGTTNAASQTLIGAVGAVAGCVATFRFLRDTQSSASAGSLDDSCVLHTDRCHAVFRDRISVLLGTAPLDTYHRVCAKAASSGGTSCLPWKDAALVTALRVNLLAARCVEVARTVSVALTHFWNVTSDESDAQSSRAASLVRTCGEVATFARGVGGKGFVTEASAQRLVMSVVTAAATDISRQREHPDSPWTESLRRDLVTALSICDVERSGDATLRRRHFRLVSLLGTASDASPVTASPSAIKWDTTLRNGHPGPSWFSMLPPPLMVAAAVELKGWHEKYMWPIELSPRYKEACANLLYADTPLQIRNAPEPSRDGHDITDLYWFTLPTNPRLAHSELCAPLLATLGAGVPSSRSIMIQNTVMPSTPAPPPEEAQRPAEAPRKRNEGVDAPQPLSRFDPNDIAWWAEADAARPAVSRAAPTAVSDDGESTTATTATSPPREPRGDAAEDAAVRQRAAMRDALLDEVAEDEDASSDVNGPAPPSLAALAPWRRHVDRDRKLGRHCPVDDGATTSSSSGSPYHQTHGAGTASLTLKKLTAANRRRAPSVKSTITSNAVPRARSLPVAANATPSKFAAEQALLLDAGPQLIGRSFLSSGAEVPCGPYPLQALQRASIAPGPTASPGDSADAPPLLRLRNGGAWATTDAVATQSALPVAVLPPSWMVAPQLRVQESAPNNDSLHTSATQNAPGYVAAAREETIRCSTEDNRRLYDAYMEERPLPPAVSYVPPSPTGTYSARVTVANTMYACPPVSPANVVIDEAAYRRYLDDLMSKRYLPQYRSDLDMNRIAAPVNGPMDRPHDSAAADGDQARSFGRYLAQQQAQHEVNLQRALAQQHAQQMNSLAAIDELARLATSKVASAPLAGAATPLKSLATPATPAASATPTVTEQQARLVTALSSLQSDVAAMRMQQQVVTPCPTQQVQGLPGVLPSGAPQYAPPSVQREPLLLEPRLLSQPRQTSEVVSTTSSPPPATAEPVGQRPAEAQSQSASTFPLFSNQSAHFQPSSAYTMPSHDAAPLNIQRSNPPAPVAAAGSSSAGSLRAALGHMAAFDATLAASMAATAQMERSLMLSQSSLAAQNIGGAAKQLADDNQVIQAGLRARMAAAETALNQRARAFPATREAQYATAASPLHSASQHFPAVERLAFDGVSVTHFSTMASTGPTALHPSAQPLDFDRVETVKLTPRPASAVVTSQRAPPPRSRVSGPATPADVMSLEDLGKPATASRSTPSPSPSRKPANVVDPRFAMYVAEPSVPQRLAHAGHPGLSGIGTSPSRRPASAHNPVVNRTVTPVQQKHTAARLEQFQQYLSSASAIATATAPL